MKDLLLNLNPPDYEAPDAIQFFVEPVKCFAISNPTSYGDGGSLGDDFGNGEGDYYDN